MTTTPFNWPIRRVIRVLDGDTIEVEIDRGFGDYSVKTVRILGVNCPETHGAEKEAGLAVRGYVEKVLAGFPMHLLSMEKPDKFGRVLGDIVDLDGVRIMDTGLCTLLIALGFAKVYHGEKKQPFTAEECAAIVAKVREVMGDA